MKTEEEVREELEIMLGEQGRERDPDAWEHVTGFIGALRWMLGEHEN